MRFRLVILLCATIALTALDAGASNVQLPRTGQSSCYDAAGLVIPCAGTDQDGDKLAGKPWPNPRFTDNNNGSVTDNLTGLVWLKNAGCFYEQPDLDVNLSWAKTVAPVAALKGDGSQCGLADGSVAGSWRIPNRIEMQSLFIPGQHPLLAGAPFTNVGSIYLASGGSISSYDGGSRWANSGERTFVWPVRDGQAGTVQLPKTGAICSVDCAGTGLDGELQKGVAWPVPRFIDNNNGTVTDNLTGLIWPQNADCNGDPFAYDSMAKALGALSWSSALAYVHNLDYNGCGLRDGSLPGDWRMPNAIELQSLVAEPTTSNARYRITPEAKALFVNLWPYTFWSSTPDYYSTSKGLSRNAYSIDLESGRLIQTDTKQTAILWPVRGGQFGDSVASILPASTDFGTVDLFTKVTQEFTLHNGGATSRMQMSAMTVSGADADLFTIETGFNGSSNCGNTTPILDPGASCTFKVSFTANSIGAKTATLRVATSDVNRPNLDVPLSGTALLNGACGAANGGTFLAAPQTNLCLLGTASPLSGTGPWTWSCTGAGGGADASCSANFQTYNVVFTAGANGTLSGTSSQTINYGGSSTNVTAIPNPHYHFVNWTGSLTSTSNPLTISSVASNLSFTANFAIDTFAVKFASGGNGTISGNGNQIVNYGTNSASVTAIAAYGYHFVNWTEGATVVSTEPTLSSTNVTAARTYTANFAPNTYEVTFAPGANGTLTGAVSQTINHGSSTTTVTAVPAATYRFVNWTEGAAVIGASAALTVSNVTAAHTYTANFAIITYAVTFSSAGSGTINGTASQTINIGANATTVTAVPAAGYHFVNWTEGTTVVGTEPALSISNVTAAHDYRANFVINSLEVSFTSGGNGTLTGATGQTVIYGSSTSVVTAVPAADYHFVNWTEGTKVISNNAALVVNNITAAHTYTANFAINTVAVTFASGGNGTLSGSTTQEVGIGAGTTPVTAVPASGYHFVNWTEGTTVVGNSVALSIATVTAAHNYTANFAINSYSVDFSSGGNGTLIGSASQSVNHGGNATTVTAVPASNYHFVNWSEGATVVGADAALTASNITAAHSYMANFAIDTYPVTFTSAGNGTISGNTDQAVAYGASAATVTAVPAPGYNFVNWTEGANVVGTGAVLSIGTVTAARNVTAHFVLGPVNGVCGTSNNGSFITAPTADLCTSGTVSPLTGTGPWSWKCTGANGGTSADCGANLQQYTVTPAAAAGSTITPQTPQTLNHGSTARFTVAPAEGYGIIVSGCSGTLRGSTYTTAAITADCSVNVTTVPRTARGTDAAQPTMVDALKALQAYSGKLTLSPEERIRYDVAPLGSSGAPVGNGAVDVADIILILRRTIGIGTW